MGTYTFSNKKSSSFIQIVTRLFILFLCASFLIPTTAIGQIIGSPGKAADFEIDANFLANNYTTPGKDWRSALTKDTVHTGSYVFPGVSNISGENAKWIIDGNSGSGSTMPEIEVFRGSSNKNGDYIGSTQSPYAIETQSPSAPQKNDLTNIYVRAKSDGGHRWVMLGAETRSVDGTSYLDFEYNQAGIRKTTTQLIGNGPNGGRTAKTDTTSGDFLFVVDFSKGGNVPLAKVFEWQSIPGKGGKPATYTWVELKLIDYPSGAVYIVTNGEDVETAGYMSGFAGNGAPSSTTLALQFVEVGVDLTALGIAPSDPCTPNSTMTVKTRTSSSYTSELKDFNTFPFAIDNPGSPIPNEDTYCQGATAVPLSATLGTGGTTLHWYQLDPNTGLYTLLSGAPTPSTATAGTFTIYYVSQSSADGCEGAKVPVPYIINPKPDRPVVTIYEATLCDTLLLPKLTVNCPIAGTYTLSQKGQTNRTFVYPDDGNTVEFANLVIAAGFSIYVTDTNGCVSDTTDCSNYKTNSCPSSSLTSQRQVQTVDQNTSRMAPSANQLIESATKVSAVPNPFEDKVRFTLESAKSGQASLEVYNMLGQKVKTLYQGYFEAGKKQTIDFNVHVSQRTNLLYIFRVGDEKTSGKLIH